MDRKIFSLSKFVLAIMAFVVCCTIPLSAKAGNGMEINWNHDKTDAELTWVTSANRANSNTRFETISWWYTISVDDKSYTIEVPLYSKYCSSETVGSDGTKWTIMLSKIFNKLNSENGTSYSIEDACEMTIKANPKIRFLKNGVEKYVIKSYKTAKSEADKGSKMIFGDEFSNHANVSSYFAVPVSIKIKMAKVSVIGTTTNGLTGTAMDPSTSYVLATNDNLGNIIDKSSSYLKDKETGGSATDKYCMYKGYYKLFTLRTYANKGCKYKVKVKDGYHLDNGKKSVTDEMAVGSSNAIAQAVYKIYPNTYTVHFNAYDINDTSVKATLIGTSSYVSCTGKGTIVSTVGSDAAIEGADIVVNAPEGYYFTGKWKDSNNNIISSSYGMSSVVNFSEKFATPDNGATYELYPVFELKTMSVYYVTHDVYGSGNQKTSLDGVLKAEDADIVLDNLAYMDYIVTRDESLVEGSVSKANYGIVAGGITLYVKDYMNEFYDDYTYFVGKGLGYGFNVNGENIDIQGILIVEQDVDFYNYDVYAFTQSNSTLGNVPVDNMISNKEYYHKSLYSGMDVSSSTLSTYNLETGNTLFFNQAFDLPGINNDIFKYNNKYCKYTVGYVNRDESDYRNMRLGIYKDESYIDADVYGLSTNTTVETLKQHGYVVIDTKEKAIELQTKVNEKYGQNKIKIVEKREVFTAGGVSQIIVIYHLGIYDLYALPNPPAVEVIFNEHDNEQNRTVTETYEYEIDEDDLYINTFKVPKELGWASECEKGQYVLAFDVGVSNSDTYYYQRPEYTYKTANGKLSTFMGWNQYDKAIYSESIGTMYGTYNTAYKTKNMVPFIKEYLALSAILDSGEILTAAQVNDRVISDAALVSDDDISLTKQINLYAVWDEFPRIKRNKNTIFSAEMIDGYADNDEFISAILEQFDITDKEDNISGKPLNTMVEMISLDEVKELKKSLDSQEMEIVSYRIKTIDSAGNETLYDCDITIKNESTLLDNNLLTMSEYYPRFITSDYYSLGDPNVVGSSKSVEEMMKDYHDLGTLNPRSKWYLVDAYRTTLNDTFARIDNNSPEEIWVFTGDTVKEVKKYIADKGFAKWKYDSGLSDFYTRFEKEAKNK